MHQNCGCWCVDWHWPRTSARTAPELRLLSATAAYRKTVVGGLPALGQEHGKRSAGATGRGPTDQSQGVRSPRRSATVRAPVAGAPAAQVVSAWGGAACSIALAPLLSVRRDGRASARRA